MPMPADTSDTARLRWVSNQPVTEAIIGVRMAGPAPPANRPNRSWNWSSGVDWLARARLAPRMAEPVSTTGGGPKRSDNEPQPMLTRADAMNPMVMALETPVWDQPVSWEIGSSKTGSENMVPMAMQP